MSRQCHTTRLACFLFRFSFPYFCNLLNYDILRNDKVYALSDCFQLTSLLFCWKKTRLEIQNLITIMLANMEEQTSFKKDDLPEWAEVLPLPERFCYSQRQRDESTKIYGGRVAQI